MENPRLRAYLEVDTLVKFLCKRCQKIIWKQLPDENKIRVMLNAVLYL